MKLLNKMEIHINQKMMTLNIDQKLIKNGISIILIKKASMEHLLNFPNMLKKDKK